VDGREYRLAAAPLGEGRWRLTLAGGRPVSVTTATAGEVRQVALEGTTFALTAITPQTARRRQRRSGGGDLTATMPGQVREVRVQPGATVAAGATLLVLEAMKMEMRVSAPAAGTVTRVCVRQGDLVERGQLLVELDTAAKEMPPAALPDNRPDD
ncbi:MAG: biotin/lipoyl-binding protein, partial [Anaerolineae bacterium]|nr:biotin/lipoyl-binding protein [Anaerolineae bacterium]